MDIEEAIRTRRTTKTFAGGESIDRATLEALIELATWAPNHGLTEPWRFTAVSGKAKASLADAADAAFAAIAKPGDDRVAKKRVDLRARINQCGAMVFVTLERNTDPTVDRENYAAACCAVQNLLLAATGRGLATYWSTAKPLRSPGVRERLGLASEDEAPLVGAVFIGRGAATRTTSRRAVNDVARFIEA